MSKTEFGAILPKNHVKLDVEIQMSAPGTFFLHVIHESMFLINGLAGKNACQFRSPASSKCLSSRAEQRSVDRMTYGRDSKEFPTAVSP